ncbi:MAG: hypothetical protein IPH16_06020 [Haliscomenobacter sp.]|nr:hypothetical protein [Haliscomenobacter sp.]MBK7475560.1 hypothetical protein [Haliscomenobacter sp.]MBK8878858.1 hypothetical protein [Haliscomenobacter sp.]
MRFLILLAVIIGLSFIAQFFTPWWTFAIVAFVSGALLSEKAFQAFAAGFLGIFLLWSAQAWWLTIGNEGILAAKMGELLGGVPGAAMPWVTGLLGGLLGGLGGWTGNQAMKAID